MDTKADIIKNNIKNKSNATQASATVTLGLSDANLQQTSQKDHTQNKKYHNFSDSVLPSTQTTEYNTQNNQEKSSLETPELNLTLLKNVLSSLLKILKEENEAMNNNCKMDYIIKSQDDKNDFNQYLEWQKPLIDSYLLEMKAALSLANQKKPTPLNPEVDKDLQTFKEIAELIENARKAAKENVLLLERRKFFNEQFVSFLADEIASYSNNTDYQYPKSALGSRSSIYQNRKAVIVNQRT